MIDALKSTILTFLAANVITIMVQVGLVFATVVLLARSKAPEIAYKVVCAVIFLGIGAAMASTTPSGWIFLGLETIITVPLLAIHKGYALTSPKVEVTAMDSKGNRISKIASQPYFGPGSNAPQADRIADALNRGLPNPLEDQNARRPQLPDEWDGVIREYQQESRPQRRYANRRLR